MDEMYHVGERTVLKLYPWSAIFLHAVITITTTTTAATTITAIIIILWLEMKFHNFSLSCTGKVAMNSSPFSE